MRRSIRPLCFLTLAMFGPVVARGEDPPTPPVPEITAAVARIEPARIEADVRKLCSFPSRHSRSAGADQAAQWIRERFLAIGYPEADVQFHEFPMGGRTCRNVVATRKGEGDSPPIIVIGAHFDSRSADIDRPDAPAPGADDNASGTAGLLELARVARDLPTRWTLTFVAFSGEEQGLFGSNAFARHALDNHLPIALMMNMDMIGHPMDAARRTITIERDKGNRRTDNDAVSQRFADAMTRAARTYTRLLPVPGPLYGSDYMGFEELGYPCVGLFDGADKAPFYHAETDLPDVVDSRYVAEALRIVLATVLEPRPIPVGGDRRPDRP